MDSGRVFIIHGWTGFPNEAWRPWLKARLEELGFEVNSPWMKSSFFPTQQEWVSTIAKAVGKVDENTFFVSQSLGAVSTLKYLQGLESGSKIGGAVLISGFTNNLGYRMLDSFFEKDFDYKKINEVSNNFEIIHCRNDVFVPVEEAYKLRRGLGGKLTVTETGNHFTELDRVRELPQALRSVLRMSKIKVTAISN